MNNPHWQSYDTVDYLQDHADLTATDLAVIESAFRPEDETPDGKVTMGGPLNVHELPGGRVEVYRVCSVKQETYSVIVSAHAWGRYQDGRGYIQDLFPTLSADDREFLKLGTTPAEWDHFMGGGEDDDE